MNNYKNIYKEVMIEYDRSRQKAEYIKKERLKEIYKKIPEIKTIDEKTTEIALKISKSILNNNSNIKDLLEELKQENLYLKKEKKILLEKSNISENFISDIYKCNLCKDTGYIKNKKCSCLIQNIINKYYNLSNLENILKEENFENFDFRYFSSNKDDKFCISPKENMKKIYKICTDFTNKFPNLFTNLLFYGHSGRGKTFLCNCIAKDILDKSYPVLYITSGSLFRTIEMTKFSKNSSIDFFEQIDIFCSIDLLIIDDLGTEFSTSVTQSEFFNIINSRLLKKLPTIISTNLSPKDLQNNYSDRIRSRLTGEYKFIKFIGEDIRSLKKYSFKNNN